MTWAVRPSGVQSVEKVSGRKPAFSTLFGHIPPQMAGAPIAEIEPDAAAAGGHHLRQNVPGVVDDAVRRRRKHVGDDIARFEEREQLGQRRHRLTHMDHHRQMERRGHFLRAPEHLEIVRAGDVPRQPRLDSGDHVAVAPDRLARGADVGAVEVHRVAFRQNAGAPDVDQNAARLRRRFGDRNGFADAIRALRSRIDQSRSRRRRGTAPAHL